MFFKISLKVFSRLNETNTRCFSMKQNVKIYKLSCTVIKHFQKNHVDLKIKTIVFCSNDIRKWKQISPKQGYLFTHLFLHKIENKQYLNIFVKNLNKLNNLQIEKGFKDLRSSV